MAEERGFAFALISDHFHPWTDRQGQSPFVWTVIGAIAQATERLRLGTRVHLPTDTDPPGRDRSCGRNDGRAHARAVQTPAITSTDLGDTP